MPQGRAGRALAILLLSTALAMLLAASVAVLGSPAQAAQDNPTCLTTDYARLPASPGPPIRFGVDPELAGDAGPVQLPATPLDDAKVVAALQRLQPAGTRLVQRLNRLFESDGEAGIARFQQRAAPLRTPASTSSCRCATTRTRRTTATCRPGWRSSVRSSTPSARTGTWSA